MRKLIANESLLVHAKLEPLLFEATSKFRSAGSVHGEVGGDNRVQSFESMHATLLPSINN